ncbi:MAG: hypothetical protein Q9223_006388, partial [Gallowayella weberi]
FVNGDSTSYFEPWFKRFDKKIERIENQISDAHVLHHETQVIIGSVELGNEKRLDETQDKITEGFGETQDKIADGFDLAQVDITRVFDKTQDKITEGFDETQDKLECGFDELEHKINEVEAKIDKTEDKIDDVERNLSYRIDDTDQMMEGRFDAVDKKMDALEAKIIDIDTVMSDHFGKLKEKMEFHFDNARALSQNSLCTQGWQRMKPVWRLNAQGERTLSRSFPHIVQSFWKLKQASQIGANLTELLSFYKVQGDSLLETGNSIADAATGTTWLSENGSKWSTLSAVVTSYPEKAHRALATELGLDYEKIQASMERAHATDQNEATTPSSEQDTSVSQGCKRRSGESLNTTDSSGTSIAPTQKVARRG